MSTIISTNTESICTILDLISFIIIEYNIKEIDGINPAIIPI